MRHCVWRLTASMFGLPSSKVPAKQVCSEARSAGLRTFRYSYVCEEGNVNRLAVSCKCVYTRCVSLCLNLQRKTLASCGDVASSILQQCLQGKRRQHRLRTDQSKSSLHSILRRTTHTHGQTKILFCEPTWEQLRYSHLDTFFGAQLWEQCDILKTGGDGTFDSKCKEKTAVKKTGKEDRSLRSRI